MKLHYSILLLFVMFFLLCFSCKKHNLSFDEKARSYHRIDSLYKLPFSQDLSLAEQLKVTEKGINLAEKLNNDSLYLKGVSYKAYFYVSNLSDSADYYVNLLSSTSKKINNKKYLAYSYSLKGNYFYDKSLYDSAYYYFKNANVLYYDVKDSLSLAYNQIMMARIHQFYNDYNASEELAMYSIEYLQRKDDLYLLEAYNILGNIYLSTQNYNQANSYYQKSLKLTQKLSVAELSLKNNIASLYISSGEYAKATTVLQETFDSKLINTDFRVKAAVLLNLGYALFKQNTDEGLEKMLVSLKIREEQNLELSSIENYIKIAEYYELKDKNVAIQCLKKSLILAKKHKSIDNQILALKKLIPLTKNNASNYSEEYIRLNDSITNVRNQAKNQFAKMRFDYSKEYEQNLLLKTKKAEAELIIQRQKNTNQLLFFGILLTGILGVYFYLIIRNRHRKEKIKEAYKTENRIAIRIHDELANDVYNTIAYTENSDLSVEGNRLKLLDDLEDVYNRTRNISKENSTVDMGEHYVESLKNMLSEYKKNELKIILAGIDDVDWNRTDSHTKIVAYRVLQELMVNMKKHSQASMVMIRFENKNKQVHVHYSDDGVGLPDEKIIFKNGLQNVENRIKTINGTITFDPKIGKGLKILITFPL